MVCLGHARWVDGADPSDICERLAAEVAAELEATPAQVALLRRRLERLAQVYRDEHGVDVAGLDFLVHIPLKQDKTAAFRDVRDEYAVNPARCYACGDEKQDFAAAISTGMHPFMVSYGFEDFARLTGKIGVPSELISQSPVEFRNRVSHGLGIDGQEDLTFHAPSARLATAEPVLA